MMFYKEFFRITIEICLAIFIIIFGYALWDNFDTTNYNIAKYYDNINEFEVYVENDTEYFVLKNKEKDVEPAKLYLHNISDKESITKLSFKISKDNEYLKENVIIKMDNNYYDIKSLECIEDEFFCYFIIDDINFSGYETKEYNLKILLNNDYSIYDNLNYEFVTNI